MTPDELAVVTRWTAAGLTDELIGANWQQNERNHGRTVPQERCSVTGRKLREEVERAGEKEGGPKLTETVKQLRDVQ
jgi:hypothetical protein